ncbi:MAG TPA: thymidylate synthase [Kineosporiaceae bacterium]
MLTLSGESINELFVQACAAVLDRGAEVSPRGMRTREVLGAWLCLSRPRRRVLGVPPRVFNPAFAAAEAVWMLSGSDAPWIYEFNQKLTAYADDGRLHGAYGPRLRRWAGRTGQVDQLERVVSVLSGDPDSRRALVQLFDPARDHRGYRDVPCTLGWRFYLREGRLHLHTTMRSQDLWLGFPYDVFTFTVLQELVAGWLGVAVGDYHHHVDSLHLYERHWDGAREACRPAGQVPPCPVMAPLQVSWPELDPLLEHLATGAEGPGLPLSGDLSGTGWAQFAVVMASYRRWKHGDRHSARTLADENPGVLTDALTRWYDHLALPVTATGTRTSAAGATA